jgi:DNA-directed RNA polymerase alpha subunit
MKIHVEFNSLAEVAAFARFTESGLTTPPAPEKTAKQLEREREKDNSYKWKYERTVQNLERALQRISMLDPKGETANYDFMPEAPTKNTRIENLELSVRAENCLKAEGINTIEELCTKPRNYLRKLPNLGKITLNEIIDALAARKLKLKGEA